MPPNQPWFPDLTETTGGTTLADPRQEGYAIPGGRLGVAFEPGAMEPSCVAASGLSEELSALQSRMLDTLTEVRAPSTKTFVLGMGHDFRYRLVINYRNID